jgi:N-acetylmuramoyl-L-alanine amidase
MNMLLLRRYKLGLNVIGLTLVLCLMVRPTLNAGDSTQIPKPVDRDSLVESLFGSANSLIEELRQQPAESRSTSNYRRALEEYDQVVRLGVDGQLSAQSLARAAELIREMADISGDPAQYRKAIKTLQRIVTDYEDSGLAGSALMSIAQIYEENIQDLEGAAAAYREIARRFPSSVTAREARAIVARFEKQLRDHQRASDVFLPPGKLNLATPDAFGASQLANVRNYNGADYARVVLDLTSQAARHSERREGDRVLLLLESAAVAPDLYGRRFIVGETNLLKRITVSERSGPAGLVDVELEVAAGAEYSLYELEDPPRLIVDLHARGFLEAGRRDFTPQPAEPRTGLSSGIEVARSRGIAPGATLELPELSEPIVVRSGDDLTRPTGDSSGLALQPPGATEGTTAEAKAGSPVRCIVIDPGHGGHDTGTIGPGGLREKDLVLDVARRLRAYIKHRYPDIEVMLTRDSDRFIALEERTAIANSRRADLFISVHANAAPSKAASGVETFFVSPDRARQAAASTTANQPAPAIDLSSVKPAATGGTQPAPQPAGQRTEPVTTSVSVGNRIAESRELARYVQAGLVRGIGSSSPRTAANRGVKHASFTVLVGSAMPSVLAEISFVSNPRDEGLLQTVQFRERIAASLFAGLNSYLKRLKSPESQKKK